MQSRWLENYKQFRYKYVKQIRISNFNVMQSHSMDTQFPDDLFCRQKLSKTELGIGKLCRMQTVGWNYLATPLIQRLFG